MTSNTNTKKFFKLQISDNTDVIQVLSGNNRETLIENFENYKIEGEDDINNPLRGHMFKTTFGYATCTIKNICENFEKDRFETLGSWVEKIIFDGDKLKNSNDYNFGDNTFSIKQRADINDDNDLHTQSNLYLKFKKGKITFVHKSDKIEIEEIKKILNNDSVKRGDLQTIYQNDKVIDEAIAKGKRELSVYLLEEKIKDTFKGLGNQILQSSNKQLGDRLMNIGIEKLKKKVIKALKNVQMPPNKDVKEAEKLLDKANLMKTIGTIVDPANVYLLGLVD